MAPGVARPRGAAPRARSREPAEGSRPGSRAARRRSTSGPRSSTASVTAAGSPTRALNLAKLTDVEKGTLVTPDVLAHDGLIRDTKLPVKILGNGDAPKGVTIHAHAFSKTALDKLTAAGSTVQRLSWPDNAPVDPEAEAKAEEAAAKRTKGRKAKGRRAAMARAGTGPAGTGGGRDDDEPETDAEAEAQGDAEAETAAAESDTESESEA